MSLSYRDTQKNFARVLQGQNLEELVQKLSFKQTTEIQDLPSPRSWTAKALKARQQWLADHYPKALDLCEARCTSPENLRGNIERQIGWVALPVGLAGPLKLRGTAVDETLHIPMATTEGALIASFSRGASAISQSGGALSLCVSEGVQRTPCLLFETALEAVQFVHFLTGTLTQWQEIVKQNSNYAQLSDLRYQLEGAMLTLVCEYTTGDAAGQNMVTFATETWLSQALNQSPIKPRQWYIEGNLSGDKKASSISLQRVRGKKVVAETVLNASSLQSLGVNADQMMRYWEISAINGILSGSVGVNGHYANGLAALMLATGQDMACVGEASIGCTRMEKRGEELYVSVSMPGLILGTVGGGTHLPGAQAALELLGCVGNGKARRLAEIAGGLALCGEISIIAALCAHDFSRAHLLYGRPRSKK